MVGGWGVGPCRGSRFPSEGTGFSGPRTPCPSAARSRTSRVGSIRGCPFVQIIAVRCVEQSEHMIGTMPRTKLTFGFLRYWRVRPELIWLTCGYVRQLEDRMAQLGIGHRAQVSSVAWLFLNRCSVVLFSSSFRVFCRLRWAERERGRETVESQARSAWRSSFK